MFCLVYYSVYKLLLRIKTGNTEESLCILFTVCVVFLLMRIAFPQNFEVKHTIYFERSTQGHVTGHYMDLTLQGHLLYILLIITSLYQLF